MIELDTLPPVLTAHEFARLSRTSVDHVWKLAREGRCPVEPLHMGRTLRFSTKQVLALLDPADAARLLEATAR